MGIGRIRKQVARALTVSTRTRTRLLACLLVAKVVACCLLDARWRATSDADVLRTCTLLLLLLLLSSKAPRGHVLLSIVRERKRLSASHIPYPYYSRSLAYRTVVLQTDDNHRRRWPFSPPPPPIAAHPFHSPRLDSPRPDRPTGRPFHMTNSTGVDLLP